MKLYIGLTVVLLLFKVVTCEDLIESASEEKDAPVTSVSLPGVNPEKPEAFLVHLKPKAGDTSRQSKFLLLLRLPDGRTETIGYNTESGETSEVLASSASAASPAAETEETVSSLTDSADQDQASAVPATDSSNSHAALTQQQQSDAEVGFEEQQRDTGLTNQQDISQSQADDALDEQQRDTALTIEQQQTEQQRDEALGQEKEQNDSRDTTQQKSDELPRDEQVRGQADDVQQTTQEQEEQVRDAPANEPQVPVILIALPPEASPLSQRSRLNKLLGALAPNADANASSKSGVNPQKHFPTAGSGFGGFGNSHTPSPAGGYGSVAMRLAAKGIAAPTAHDVQRPELLRAILSPIMKGRTNSHFSTKGGSLRAHEAAAHTKGGNNVQQSLDATKGGSNRAHEAAVHSTGRSNAAHEAAVHGTKGSSGRLSAPTKGGNLRNIVQVREPAQAVKGGSILAQDATKGTSGRLSAPIKGINSPANTVQVREQVSTAKGTRGSASQGSRGVTRPLASPEVKVYSRARASPAAIAKSRARQAAAAAAAAAPSYSSSNVHPINSDVTFDDEAADGFTSKASSTSYSSAPVNAAAPTSSVPTAAASVPSTQFTTNVGGKERMVLLLFNKGELDPAVAESTVHRAVASY